MDSLETSSETAYRNESLLDRSSNNTETAREKFQRTSRIVLAMRSLRKITGGVKEDVGFSDEYQSVESSRHSLKLSLLVVLAYLVVGTITYAVWMDWTIIDAMYFTAVTFTTIGYGDITPGHGLGVYVFTTIFVLIGISVLGGIALTIIFDRLFSLYEEISEQMKSEKQSYFMNLFDSNDSAGDKEHKSFGKEVLSILRNSSPLLLALISPSIVIGYLEGWSMSRALYFCAITATTGKIRL